MGNHFWEWVINEKSGGGNNEVEWVENEKSGGGNNGMEWVKNGKSGGGNNGVEWVIKKNSGGGNGVVSKKNTSIGTIHITIWHPSQPTWQENDKNVDFSKLILPRKILELEKSFFQAAV